MKLPAFLKDRGIKRIVGLDFETYFDKDYSLKKQGVSTTEYIRDSRFNVQCVGIQLHSQKKGRWYDRKHATAALQSIDWSSSALLAHHAHFDGLILAHHFNVRPAFYFDTLSMARPLHGNGIRNDLDTLSKHYGGGGKVEGVLDQTKGVLDLPPELLRALGDYCAQDVTEMWRIFECMLADYPQAELEIIHHTIRCYCDPVLQVDIDLAKRLHEQEVKRKKAVLRRVKRTAEELRSRDTFAACLQELGVEPPMKTSPRTGMPTFAFAKADLDFQELRNHPNKKVRDLIEAREITQSSINETRPLRLISHAEPALPVYLKYGGAHTLRWSGGDLVNLQNLGRQGELRNVVKAPKGYTLVIVDSAQIEARVVAWLAGQDDLLEAFGSGADIYREFAGEEIYKKPIAKVNDKERFVGKTSILGLGFQMGVPKFRYTLEAGIMGPPVRLSEELYEKAVYGYRTRFQNIVKLWERALTMIQGPMTHRGEPRVIKSSGMFTETNVYEDRLVCLQFGYRRINLPNGLALHYPRLRWDAEEAGYVFNEGIKLYGGKLVENIVQCLARIIVAEQIRSVADRYRLVLCVHDEGVFCVPTKLAKKALEEIIEAFRVAPCWCPEIPLNAEGVISEVYLKP